MALTVEPMEESFTPSCDCCGRPTRTVWGYVHSDSETTAYYVHWSPGHVAESGAFWDFVVGSWGDEASAQDRSSVSLEFRITVDGPQYMVIDSTRRPISSSSLIGRGLKRCEVVGAPLAAEIFDAVDAISIQDLRVAELFAHGREDV